MIFSIIKCRREVYLEIGVITHRKIYKTTITTFIKQYKLNNGIHISYSFPPSIQQFDGQPDDGILLDLIFKNENIVQIDISLDSFAQDNQFNTQFALQEDVNNPQVRRNLAYNWHYHHEHLLCLISEIPNNSFCLSNHLVTTHLRGKMIDWMIEVFGNYENICTDFTFFRAVTLMDHYMKVSTSHHKDSDLHLIGVACMFISTKLEDIYHITLRDFVSRVSHNKFSAFQIKSAELQILESLKFYVTFPTTLDYMRVLMHRCFNLNDNPNLQNIQTTAVFILKMTLFDYKLLEFQPNVLCCAILSYAIQKFYTDKSEQIDQSVLEKYQHAILKAAQCDLNHYQQCSNYIYTFAYSFQSKYSHVQNLEKYG